jgi:hypothetical protein
LSTLCITYLQLNCHTAQMSQLTYACAVNWTRNRHSWAGATNAEAQSGVKALACLNRNSVESPMTKRKMPVLLSFTVSQVRLLRH